MLWAELLPLLFWSDLHILRILDRYSFLTVSFFSLHSQVLVRVPLLDDPPVQDHVICLLVVDPAHRPVHLLKEYWRPQFLSPLIFISGYMCLPCHYCIEQLLSCLLMIRTAEHKTKLAVSTSRRRSSTCWVGWVLVRNIRPLGGGHPCCKIAPDTCPSSLALAREREAPKHTPPLGWICTWVDQEVWLCLSELTIIWDTDVKNQFHFRTFNYGFT